MQCIKDADRPPRPPFVNNSRLHQIDSLAEETDFTFKSPSTWEYIKEQYPGSGPDIARTVLPDGRVEMSKLVVNVVRYADLKSDGKSDDSRGIELSQGVFQPAKIASHLSDRPFITSWRCIMA